MQSLDLQAKNENLDKLNSFVHTFLEQSVPDFSDTKLLMQIDLTVEEVFVNIASYAYKGKTGSVKVLIDYKKAEKELSLCFMDSGIPFNPLEKAEPDTSLGAEERQIGGLGIFLVKKYMDKIEYFYDGKQNILTVYKKICK